jgi:hypothetical protein
MDYVATSCPHRGVDTVLDEYDGLTVARLRCRYCHERIGRHQHLGHDLYVYQIAPGAMTVSNWTATP